MIALGGHLVEARQNGAADQIVVGLTDNPSLPTALRPKYGLILEDGQQPAPGFAVCLAKTLTAELGPAESGYVELPPTLSYLAAGDIVRVDFKTKKLRTLYRRASPTNFFLLTERCDHYCLMCSQPPKNVNDDWILESVMAAVPFIPPESPFIGITGGEPTLLGDKFLDLIRRLKSYLPSTPVHILSNGKRFADPSFTAKYAAIGHPAVTVGIPIYSDISGIHDYVVQSDGAFDATIRGIIELKRRSQKVEVRIVISKQTYDRLPKFAEFIYRNLTFVDHVAFMGLELTGFAKANLESLWIDPVDYKDVLAQATTYLDRRGMKVSIYNHQLCTLDQRSWHLARKSISDWKNEYLPECDSCSIKSQCGGFFTTSTLRRSRGIEAIQQ